MAATLNGRYGYYKQSEGWRMLRSGLQFKLFGSGPVLSAGVEAGAFVDPTDPQGIPKIQAFCVPSDVRRPQVGGSAARHFRGHDHHRRGQAALARDRAARGALTPTRCRWSRRNCSLTPPTWRR